MGTGNNGKDRQQKRDGDIGRRDRILINEAKKAAIRKYNNSDKGKAAQQRYKDSGKQRVARINNSGAEHYADWISGGPRPIVEDDCIAIYWAPGE